LCYHRVTDNRDDRFQGYKPNISASRETFIQQIDHLRAHYNPISLRDIVTWLDEGPPLPPRPALVTFDDGYRDNGEIAWPIMRDRGVPAVIFLATDHIGTGRPFSWDLAAYFFSRTARRQPIVPLIGSVILDTTAHRDACTAAWVDAVKRIPASKCVEAIARLSAALDVASPPKEMLRHLYLDWSDVRRLAEQGVEFGGHTCTHPILTSLALDEANIEIEDSIRHLTAMLGSKPLGFAYPNGAARDYAKGHEETVRRNGVPVAFSLEPGPTWLSEVRERPLAVRRIYVGRQDHLPRFVAKLAGAARLTELLRTRQKKLWEG
jgi:peptidoglycan/xylan/chitin deacetylase (PgdA/CDA1 family)